MKTRLLASLVFAALVAGNVVLAEEKKTVEEQMQEFAKGNPGVCHVKLDDQGRIDKLIVVGRADINTVLGESKGLQMARKSAQRNAVAEFVKHLENKVEVYENESHETAIFTEGSKGGEKDGRHTAGKAVDKTSEGYKSATQGLVRGLSVLHSETNGQAKTCTVVMGWSAARAKAAHDAKANDRTVKDSNASGEGDKKPVEKETIPDSKATSKDAGDFLN